MMMSWQEPRALTPVKLRKKWEHWKEILPFRERSQIEGFFLYIPQHSFPFGAFLCDLCVTFGIDS